MDASTPLPPTAVAPASQDVAPSDVAARWRRRLALALVAVLPLHTVFVSAWISWKPWLVLVALLVLLDAADGLAARTWPWRRDVSLALGIFLLVVLVGWPPAAYRERFLRLLLALVAGGLVLLTLERALRPRGMLDRALVVVRWTGAAMGLTAVGFSLAALGAFGPDALDRIADLPGVFRVAKPAYLREGFLALTNWHQDPGYGAAWATLWAVLVLVGGVRLGRPWWEDGLIVGGLGFAVVMAFSRTGWAALAVATAVTVVTLWRRGGVPLRDVGRRVGAAALVAALLLGVVGSLDPPEVGGDLDLQFRFRLGQSFELVSTLFALFGADVSEEPVEFSPAEQRADVWPEYWRMFLDHPVTGVGLSVGWQTNSIRQEPHNLFLELLAETGLLGFAAFLLLLAVILRGGGGLVGGLALFTAFLPAMTQTVLFEPAWWFAAALWLAGRPPRAAPGPGRTTPAVKALPSDA